MSAPTSASHTLTDGEFHARSQAVLGAIEAALDRWLQDDVIDIDSHRTGGLLELDIPGGGKIVVNTQPPLHELWLAARSGGYHYRHDGRTWVDTKTGEELFANLSREATAQAAQPLQFLPD